MSETMQDCLWVAHSLYDRNRSGGASGNISFREKDTVLISATGSSFGRLKAEEMSRLNLSGERISGPKPSKEFPLHLQLYASSPEIQCVIHVHSPAAVLWSCLPCENETDAVPAYTPYLQMRVGPICHVPYHPPGSQELFDAFGKRLSHFRGFLLQQHGIVVAGTSVMDAFAGVEELEDACRIAWALRNEHIARL